MKALQILIAVNCFLLLLVFNSSAQSVGINNTGASADASALLDLSATDKGFLITRADTLNINAPAFGLLTLSPADSCLYLYNGINWMGMGGAGSNCACNINVPPICESSFTDARDGETYGAVEIGSQCWMSKNLNYTPNSGNSWCYDNDNNNCNLYGRLYDWNTAMNSESSSSANPSGVQGICPVGWHLPSDEEWKELELFLGMSPAELNNTSWRGTVEGAALKSSSNWNGNNSTGFSGLPGGYRFTDATFRNKGGFGYWWSTTENGADAWCRRLGTIQDGVIRHANNGKHSGYSVRCVQD